jgi:hypothetical protein
MGNGTFNITFFVGVVVLSAIFLRWWSTGGVLSSRLSWFILAVYGFFDLKVSSLWQNKE